MRRAVCSETDVSEIQNTSCLTSEGMASKSMQSHIVREAPVRAAKP
jgi:hypothetical protein